MIELTIARKQYFIDRDLEKDAGSFRQVVQLLSQMLTELDMDRQADAVKYERTPDRKIDHNGHPQWSWKARVGEIDLSILKLPKGIGFPGLLEQKIYPSPLEP